MIQALRESYGKAHRRDGRYRFKECIQESDAFDARYENGTSAGEQQIHHKYAGCRPCNAVFHPAAERFHRFPVAEGGYDRKHQYGKRRRFNASCCRACRSADHHQAYEDKSAGLRHLRKLYGIETCRSGADRLKEGGRDLL